MSENKKLKFLFEFDIDLKKEVETKEESNQEDGSVVTITKKEKRAVPQKVFIRKPNRSLYDEAELYYNVCVSKGMEAGLMSQVFLAKRFLNDGGALSKPELEDKSKNYLKYWEDEVEIQRLSAKALSDRTPEEVLRLEELIKEQAEAKQKLNRLELRESSIFDITAESRARTKTILWWTLFLTHVKTDKGEYTPVFTGESIEEKLESLDELDEEGIDESKKEFISSVLTWSMSAITMWFYNKDTTQEDILKFIKTGT